MRAWSGERAAWSVERPASLTSRALHAPGSTLHAFTLIELMVVIGILAMIMTMSVPAIRGALRDQGMSKVVREAQEVCMNARARAILNGSITEVVFHADPPTVEVAGGRPAPGSGLKASLTLSDDVGIESIKVNGVECKDTDTARVRFFPNGTCDELRLVLLRPKDNMRRGVFLEVTTSLADVVVDQNRLFAEAR